MESSADWFRVGGKGGRKEAEAAELSQAKEQKGLRLFPEGAAARGFPRSYRR